MFLVYACGEQVTIGTKCKVQAFDLIFRQFGPAYLTSARQIDNSYFVFTEKNELIAVRRERHSTVDTAEA